MPRTPRRRGVGEPAPRRTQRRELRFLALFVLLLAGSFALISWKPVDEGAIEPLTAGVARASAALLDGLLLGLVAIQAINLVRVAALFLTGAYFPRWFDTSHTAIWQTVVVLFGCLLWIWWASRFGLPRTPRPAGRTG